MSKHTAQGGNETQNNTVNTTNTFSIHYHELSLAISALSLPRLDINTVNSCTQGPGSCQPTQVIKGGRPSRDLCGANNRRIRDVGNTEILMPGRWLKTSGLNLVQIMLENRILMQILKYYLDARYFLVSHYPVTIMDICNVKSNFQMSQAWYRKSFSKMLDIRYVRLQNPPYPHP